MIPTIIITDCKKPAYAFFYYEHGNITFVTNLEKNWKYADYKYVF
jgi:hypothetical protein